MAVSLIYTFLSLSLSLALYISYGVCLFWWALWDFTCYLNESGGVLEGRYCWLKSGRLGYNFSLLGADEAESCPVESDTRWAGT